MTTTNTTQTILVSKGAVEYTFPLTLTEVNGADISADTVLLSLGTFADPGTDWHTPDVETHPTTSSVTAKLLIGSSYVPTAGTYYVWVKITDNPEIAPRRGGKLVIA